MTMRSGVVLLCFLAGAGVLAAPRTPAGRQTAGPRDPQLIDVQGYEKLVQQYRGRLLLVTFWATWCEPCRDEYPMLNELAKQYAPQGLRVVGVSLDQDGDLILMRRFMARYRPVFPNYRKKPTEEGGSEERAFLEAVSPGWKGTLPASFFYAKDGRQVGNFVGERNRETYEGAIRSLLNLASN